MSLKSKYNLFNNWVYNYYLENCISNQLNTLSIPSSEIDEFANENNIELHSFKELNKESWYYLIKTREGIPQYFGLIALQCYAAYLMENDGEINITAANFKNPFIRITGLSPKVNLIKLFSENFPNHNTVQEEIWFQAKDFLSKKGIIIELPSKKSHAGRYIQYPLSQVILNSQDLKEYKVLFQKIYSDKAGNIIAFNDFKKILKNEVQYHIKGFKRLNNLKFDSMLSESEKKIKYKQIFDYYNSNDWYLDKEKKGSQIAKILEKYYLKIDKFDFRLYNQHFQQLNDSSSNHFLSRQKYVLFKNTHDYQNEYESVNSFSADGDFIILIFNAPSNKTEIKELKNSFDLIFDSNDNKNILVYKVNLKSDVPLFLRKLLITDYPIILKGYKISGKKKYFTTSPPKIISIKTANYVVYFEKKRIDLNDINKAGRYTIKVNGFTNYNFELIDPPKLEFACKISEKGLSFKTLKLEEGIEAHMFGLNVNYQDKNGENILTINNWISALKGSKTPSNNQILKAVTQKYYGKNF